MSELIEQGRYDLVNAICKYSSPHEVASRLGLNGRELRRPRHYWDDFSNLERDLSAFVAEHGQTGVMPTARELDLAGCRSLVDAINKHGGQFAVAKRLGLTERQVYHPPGYWDDFSNLEQKLRAFLVERGTPTRIPTQVDFLAEGRSDISGALHHHGGLRVVAERLGLSLSSQAKPHGYWKDFSNLEREIRAFILDHGRPGQLPTEAELSRAGRMDIGCAIDTQGGYVAVAQRLGLRNVMQGAQHKRWKDFGVLAQAVRDFMVEQGQQDIMPTMSQLEEAGCSDLIAGIRHFGGFDLVAQQLGLQSMGRGRRRSTKVSR